MPDSLQVLLVRHGESIGNAGHATEDAASTELTARGVQQARAVTAALPGPPALIVASSYTRSQRTAEPTRARFPHVPFEVWPVHEFTYLGPHAYAGTTLEERQPAVEAYWDASDPHGVAGEGAESFATFLARVAEVRARLERGPATPVVVFSHKKFINALLWSWLAGEPVVSSRRMARYRGFDRAVPFPNGGSVEVRIEAGQMWISPVRGGAMEGLPE